MKWVGTPTPGGWAYTHDGTGAQIVLDYMHPTAKGLDAWVELRVPDQEIPVSAGTRNLMSVQAARPFIEDTAKSPHKVPWEAGLRQAFHEVILAHRDGAATVDLTGVDANTDTQFMLEPLVESGGMTRLIAAGGSGKSLLAMAAALTIATGTRYLGLDPAMTGPVLYLDWETDQATHKRRIDALRASVGAPEPDRGLMMYRSETGPLARSVQAVRRACDRYGVVFLVVDSRQMAAGPSGGYGGAEDTALNLYLALREIGRPGLIVDHKTKADIEKGRRGGYGSVFNENLARLQWEMTKVADISQGRREFVLELSKENNVGRLRPIGFRLDTDGDSTGITAARFTLIDPANVSDTNRDDMTERIAAALSAAAEPLTVEEVAVAAFGAAEATSRKNSVRTRLNQDRRFENVSTDRTGRWRIRGQTGDEGAQRTLHAVPDENDEDEGPVIF